MSEQEIINQTFRFGAIAPGHEEEAQRLSGTLQESLRRAALESGASTVEIELFDDAVSLVSFRFKVRAHPDVFRADDFAALYQEAMSPFASPPGSGVKREPHASLDLGKYHAVEVDSAAEIHEFGVACIQPETRTVRWFAMENGAGLARAMHGRVFSLELTKQTQMVWMINYIDPSNVGEIDEAVKRILDNLGSDGDSP